MVIDDGTKAALINSHQSKAFDRVDYRFLVTVLETAGFQSEFWKWISMMYHNLQTVVEGNRKYSEAFGVGWSVWQGCSLSPILYVIALE